MLKGVLLVLSACCIWGLNYVLPGLMTGYSALEVTLGGYFFLGVLSCLLMAGKGKEKWLSIPKKLWLRALGYSLVVNILYYLALVTGLRYSNASVIALLMGLSPITLSFYGNWRRKECSYRHLMLTSFFIGAGLVCVNWEAFFSLSGQASWEYLLGLMCGICALVAWNWYIVANADFLKKHPLISASDWSSMIGVATFIWVLLIVPLFFIFSSPEDLSKYSSIGQPFYYFLAGCLVLGLACSWLAFFFWNHGSQFLPLSLAGQLTIFETIFGILFFYLLEASFPSFLELFGMVLTLAGVSLSVHLFRKPSNSAQSELVPSPAI